MKCSSIYLKYGGKTLGKDVDKEFSTDLSTICIFQTVTTIAVLVVAIILRDETLRDLMGIGIKMINKRRK